MGDGKEMEGKGKEGDLYHPAAPHQVLTSAAASSTNQSINVCCGTHKSCVYNWTYVHSEPPYQAYVYIQCI